MYRILILLTFVAPVLMGCPHKKDVIDVGSERAKAAIANYRVYSTPVTGNEMQLVADSTFLFSREMYLWNTDIPANKDSSLLEVSYPTFNPRQYVNVNTINTADNVLNAIIPYSAGKDRFSFATSIEESDQIQTGQGVDWGFFVDDAAITSPASAENIRWFITYVYPASDAGAKGVKRGWYINKIDGVAITGNQTSVDKLNALFFGTTTTANIDFVKPDGSTQTLTINKTNFQSNGILYSNVFTSTSGKKIGYFVFNQFLGTQTAYNELTTVFNNLINQGISELIIDLRNNRGGSTAMQDALANIIVPASKDGTVMYRYEFNPLLQSNNFSLLKTRGLSNGTFTLQNNTENFDKNGSLALSRVFFIVTGNSASASELLINNLKPVMDVKLIGKNTYGKPVGFFPVEFFNKVAIYPISFRTINSAGTADYYSGFAPDKVADDGVNKDWGDVTDPCLANALAYINTGRFLTVAEVNTLPRSVSSSKNLILKDEDKRFSGMYIGGKFNKNSATMRVQ